MTEDTTRIPATTQTRDNVLYPLKRPQETWDDLFQRLATHYEECNNTNE